MSRVRGPSRAARHETHAPLAAEATGSRRAVEVREDLEEVTRFLLSHWDTSGELSRSGIDWVFEALDRGELTLDDLAQVLAALGDRTPPSLRDALRASRSTAELLTAIAADSRGSGRRRHTLGEGPGAGALAEQLDALLPALGLEPSSVVVQIDDHAAERARQHGTVGLAIESRVYLDPQAYDPRSSVGREILAHELAHVAQWRLGRSGLSDPMNVGTSSAEAAELEAANLARLWVGGHLPQRPSVPLGPATPAGFSFLEDVIQSFGGSLRERFIGSIIPQLEGTLGAPLVPGLEKWAKGELEFSEEEARQAASDKSAAEKAADDLGNAGADALVTGAKVTLFFIRAFFGLLSKLKLLPIGLQINSGPFGLRVGATANFKTVEMWGRIEVDFARIHKLFQGLTGVVAAGEAPASEPAEGAGDVFELVGAKRAKVNPDKDVHAVVPWKSPLGGWEVRLPPTPDNPIAGWKKGRVDMKGLHLDKPRIGMPSLGDILVWTEGDDHRRVDVVWFEADTFDLGVDNALRGVKTLPNEPDLSVSFGGPPIGGLEGVSIKGDLDLSNDDAVIAAACKRAWIDLWGFRVELGDTALKYSTAAGPSTEARSFDTDLAGWFQVHAEDMRLDKDGFTTSLLRVPVPRNVQEILSSLDFIQWSLVPKSGGDGTAGAGIPQFALAWHDLRIGRDGFRVVPSLEPDLSQYWLSLRIGSVFEVRDFTAAVTGLETWLESPSPDKPPASPRFEMAAGVGTLSLFGTTAQVQQPHVSVSTDGFEGSTGGAVFTAGPLEASLGGLRIDGSGFACDPITTKLTLGGDFLGQYWPELALLPTLELSATLEGVAYRAAAKEAADAPPAGFSVGDAVFRIGTLPSVSVPGAFLTELLTVGPLQADWKKLQLTGEQLVELGKAAASQAIEVAKEGVAEVVAYAEEVITGWWQTISTWLPGADAERPPQMSEHDVVMARLVTEKQLWDEVKTHVERVDANISGFEVLDRQALDTAKRSLALGLLWTAFEQLQVVAAGDGDAAAAAFFQACIAEASALEAAMKGGTVPAGQTGTDAAAETSTEGTPDFKAMNQYRWYGLDGEELPAGSPVADAWIQALHDLYDAANTKAKEVQDAAGVPDGYRAKTIGYATGLKYDYSPWWNALNAQVRKPPGQRAASLEQWVKDAKGSSKLKVTVPLPAGAGALDGVMFIPGDFSCFEAVRGMQAYAGAESQGKDTQIAIFDSSSEVASTSGRTKLDRSTADMAAIRAATAQATEYLDATLPVPVMIGVTYRSTTNNANAAGHSTADHWIVAFEKRGAVYRCADPANGSEGDLAVDGDGVLCGTFGSKFYEVQTVRKSKVVATQKGGGTTASAAPSSTPASSSSTGTVASAGTPTRAATPTTAAAQPTVTTVSAPSDASLASSSTATLTVPVPAGEGGQTYMGMAYDQLVAATDYAASWWYGTSEAAPASGATAPQPVPTSAEPAATTATAEPVTAPAAPSLPPLPTEPVLTESQVKKALSTYEGDKAYWPAERVALVAEALGLGGQSVIDEAFVQAVGARQQHFGVPVDGIIGKRGTRSEAEGRSTALYRSLFGDDASEAQQSSASALTAARESGKEKYAAYQNVDSGIVSYGIHQCTASSGSLGLVINAYLAKASGVTPKSQNAVGLEAYRGVCDRGADAVRKEALRHDGTFKTLLVAAAVEPEMQAAQEEVFEDAYWKPAVGLATSCGLETSLSYAAIYDATIQHGPDGAEEMADGTIAKLGGIVGSVKDGQTITETLFITTFNDIRARRLMDLAARDRKKAAELRAAGKEQEALAKEKNAEMLEHGVSRPEGFNELAEEGNLELTPDADGNVTVGGKKVAMPTG